MFPKSLDNRSNLLVTSIFKYETAWRSRISQVRERFIRLHVPIWEPAREVEKECLQELIRVLTRLFQPARPFDRLNGRIEVNSHRVGSHLGKLKAARAAMIAQKKPDVRRRDSGRHRN